MNLSEAMNRKSNPYHLQSLILAAMIFHNLTTKIWNIQHTRLEKEKRELSLEQLIKTFSSYLVGLRESWEQINLYDPDPRHIAYGKRRKRKAAVLQPFSPLT